MKFIFLFILLTISVNTFAENLIKVEALNGKISLMVPDSFGPMSKDMLEIKYPMSRRPTEVLSDKTGAVTLAFNHTNNATLPSQIKEAHVAMSKMFHNLHPSATWFRDEVINQNGKDFIVMELITPAIDTKIHNIIYGTSVDGRFLLMAFNTTVEKSEEWLPIGKKIMKTFSIQ